MSTPLIRSIIRAVLLELDRRELLEVAPGVDLHQLADRISATMQGAKAFSQFSSWLSDALLASDDVVELYASNEELLDVLRDVSA